MGGLCFNWADGSGSMQGGLKAGPAGNSRGLPCRDPASSRLLKSWLPLRPRPLSPAAARLLAWSSSSCWESCLTSGALSARAGAAASSGAAGASGAACSCGALSGVASCIVEMLLLCRPGGRGGVWGQWLLVNVQQHCHVVGGGRVYRPPGPLYRVTLLPMPLFHSSRTKTQPENARKASPARFAVTGLQVVPCSSVPPPKCALTVELSVQSGRGGVQRKVDGRSLLVKTVSASLGFFDTTSGLCGAK